MRRLFVMLVLVGCKAAPSATLLPAPETIVSTQPSASAIGAPCAAPRFVVAPKVEVHCWPEPTCKESFGYALDNCTDAAVELKALFVLQGGDPLRPQKGADVQEVVFDPPLRLAARTTRKVTHAAPGVPGNLWIALGHYKLLAKTSGDAGVPIEQEFDVVDPGLEKAKVECLARGDDWGEHGGLFSSIGCAPVMPDAGKACSDERDCHGLCVLDRYEPVSTTEHRVIGHCTRLSGQLGCSAIIGKTSGGLLPIDRRVPRLCVD